MINNELEDHQRLGILPTLEDFKWFPLMVALTLLAYACAMVWLA